MKSGGLSLWQKNRMRGQMVYFFEDLAVLLRAGMDIVSAVRVMERQSRNKLEKKFYHRLSEELESGNKLWKTLEAYQIAPIYMISLIHIGEESGNLPENLKMAVKYQQQLEQFTSRTRSALIYPAIVVSLGLIVGLAVSWFVIPRIAQTLSSFNLQLPLLTVALISFGNFITRQGLTTLPWLAGGIITVFLLLFVVKQTRWVGQLLLFNLPIAHDVIRSNEIARAGYILGILLQAGMPIVRSLEALRDVTEATNYRSLYQKMRDAVEAGSSFEQFFNDHRSIDRFIPQIAQHIMFAGEKSGQLPESLLMMGETFQLRADAKVKNLTIILEPVALIIVGLLVLLFAFAVILPIYSFVSAL